MLAPLGAGDGSAGHLHLERLRGSPLRVEELRFRTQPERDLYLAPWNREQLAAAFAEQEERGRPPGKLRRSGTVHRPIISVR